MSTKILRYLILLTCVCHLFNAAAQDEYQFGLLPALNLNKKMDNLWSVNFKTESRQQLSRGIFQSPASQSYEYILTDISLITAKKVGLNAKVNGGYQIRFRGGETIHRLIQQYTVVQRKTGFRLAHRWASDQTFVPNESTEWRLRYRLTSEIPLSGQSVDPQEFYLKINNEYLQSFQGSDYDIEIRLIPFLGYNFIGRSKTEIGLDYRLSSFLDNTAQHTFWISLNWFVEI